jgi:hypothetical protein
MKGARRHSTDLRGNIRFKLLLFGRALCIKPANYRQSNCPSEALAVAFTVG